MTTMKKDVSRGVEWAILLLPINGVLFGVGFMHLISPLSDTFLIYLGIFMMVAAAFAAICNGKKVFDTLDDWKSYSIGTIEKKRAVGN